MNAKPLSQENFEALKLIIRTKYQGEIHMEEMAKLSYDQYLSIRQALVDRADTYSACCFKGADHDVFVYIEEYQYINVKTGDSKGEITEERARCQVCESPENDIIAYEGGWGEAESLIEE